jgi:hypothetical protein
VPLGSHRCRWLMLLVASHHESSMIIATRARPLWFRIPVIMVRIVRFGKTLVRPGGA